MRIIVDIDDVIADLMPVWLRLYNENTGDSLTPSDITDWDITKFVRGGARIYDYLNYSTLYDTVKPVPYALIAIALVQKHHDVLFVTAMGSWSKLCWLERFGLIPSKTNAGRKFIVAQDKSLIKADMIIDDRAETVFNYPGEGIIFARPWNDVKLWPLNIHRIDGWPAIIKHLGLGEL